MLKFLQMGGFAQYVWPAYAFAVLLLMLNIGWARRSLRRAQLEARRRLQRGGGQS